MNLSEEKIIRLEIICEKLEQDFLQVINNSHVHPSLCSGDEGKLMFLIQRQIDRNRSDYIDTISERIMILWHHYNNNSFLSLANGLTGFLFFLRWVKDSDYFEVNEEEIIKPLESRLQIEMLNEENQDYLHGYSGMLWYFLLFSKNDEFLFNIINKYVTSCIQNDERVWWKDMFVPDRINLSLSHGLAGHVIILSKILERFPLRDDITHLINKSIKTILDEIQTTESNYAFIPDIIGYNQSPQNVLPRQAWCYGDLGRALALLTSGKIVNSQRAIDSGLMLINQSLSIKDPRLRDTMLCHGISGIYLLLETFKDSYPNPDVFKTEIDWGELLIEFILNSEISIHKFFDSTFESFETNRGFLTGSSGVALVIADIMNSRKSNFKHLLLL